MEEWKNLLEAYLNLCSIFVCSTGLGTLAQATVTGLPAETVGPAEVSEIPKAGEVLLPHTTPRQDFGKEVGLVYHLISRVAVE